MIDHPLYHGLAGVMLDCNDPACFGICDLGPHPGESRGDWLGRLRARFATEPIPLVVGTPAHRLPIVLEPCGVCGASKKAGAGACIACVARRRRVAV